MTHPTVAKMMKWAATRRAQMLVLWKSGQTLQQIGDEFNISRERVRQILKTSAATGGQHKRAQVNKGIRAVTYLAKRNGYCQRKYGCSWEQYRAIRGDSHYYDSPIYRYVQQRTNAKRRKIDWEFTLPDWWLVWQQSGKWNHRGRGAYVMSRIGDKGPYKTSNVIIKTSGENFSEAAQIAKANGKSWGRKLGQTGGKKGYCKNGHKLIEENLYYSGETRYCRLCNLMYKRKARDKQILSKPEPKETK